MFLLHGTFIRFPLCWALYRFLDSFKSLHVFDFVEDSYDQHKTMRLFYCQSFLCKLSVAWIYVVWFGLLLVCATLWHKYMDGLGIRMSTWAEAVMKGEMKMEFAPKRWHQTLYEERKAAGAKDVACNLEMALE